jgi:hypothetical protein
MLAPNLCPCCRGRRDSGYQRQTAHINESIAQAFVKFLEEESTPHTPIVLPVLEMARSKQASIVPALFEIPALFRRPGFPALFEVPALFRNPSFPAFSVFLPSSHHNAPTFVVFPLIFSSSYLNFFPPQVSPAGFNEFFSPPTVFS